MRGLLWLLIPTLLVAEDVSLPALVTVQVQDNRVAAAETHGVSLPDSYVDQLLQFKPPNKNGTYPMTILVSKPSVDYRGSSRMPCSLGLGILEDAASLTVDKATKREAKLKTDASSTKDRSALLLFAANQDAPDMQQMRHRQIAWLVENQPHAPVLCQPEAMISKSGAPAEYAAVKELWLKAVREKPQLNQLESASNFLRASDAEDVYRILGPFRNEFTAARTWLGESYALGGVGMTEWGSKDGPPASAAASLPAGGFAASARATLLESPDLVVLTSAINALREAGARLRLGSGLPEGFRSFCESVATRIRALKPNSLFDCELPSAPSPARYEPKQIQKGSVTRRVQPVYPQIAKNLRIQGTVVVSAIIDKQGKVRDVEFVKGPLLLYQSSAVAVRQWEYKPFMLNGEPVEVKTDIDVVYSVR